MNFTVLALGVSLFIVAASQSSWQAPRLLSPLLLLGRKSYEIYLTHMFAVLALFAAFVHLGKPLRGVPILFGSAICLAALLGWAVSAFFAEPMNRLIRRRSQIDALTLGTVIPKTI